MCKNRFDGRKTKEPLLSDESKSIYKEKEIGDWLVKKREWKSRRKLDKIIRV